MIDNARSLAPLTKTPGIYEEKTERGDWIDIPFRGDYVYQLESGEIIPERDVMNAEPFHVIRSFQIECPSIVFVRLRDDDTQTYHFIKLVSNILNSVQSQCFVHQKYSSQSNPDQ
jgi:hypothetical protein